MADFELLIFDWDGTLADSIGRIVDAMQAAATSAGHDVRDAGAIKGIIGLELSLAILTLYPSLSADQLKVFRDLYAEHYMRMDASPSPLFPGVREALGRLRAQGYKLAVATGKARRGLNRVLAAHGLEDFFDITRAADETASKPHPLMLQQVLAHCGVAPGRALMVGDSAFDIQMAHNAGVTAVAVGYGAIELSSLREHLPQVEVQAFAEFEAWLATTRTAGTMHG